jgi:hypothetical protein
MPEQYANLENLSLAAKYTPGDGFISVSSVVGLPTVGTFSLTMVDRSTNVVIMIFRVTSIVGSALFGAAEGPDKACPAGTLVYGTVLTAAAMSQVVSDAGVGSNATPPVLTAFTPNSTDITMVTNNTSGPSGFTMLVPTGKAGSEDLQVLGVAAPSGAYYVDAAAVAVVTEGGAGLNGGFGLCFIESLADKLHHYSCIIYGFFGTSTAGLGITSYDSTTVHDSAPKNTEGIWVSRLIWFRLHDDGVTNRDYWISPDGINWYMFYQEARGTLFTPTAVGVCFNPFSCSGVVNWLSWNIHT